MKSERQNLILNLVANNVISTQDELQQLLLKNGYNVTQATISRDINELALIKTCVSEGIYKYSVPGLNKNIIDKNTNSILSILSDGIISVDYALNTAVIKCHTGMAQAVCAKLDTAELENVVGTLAGDDTIFILMRTERDALRFIKELNIILNRN